MLFKLKRTSKYGDLGNIEISTLGELLDFIKTLNEPIIIYDNVDDLVDGDGFTIEIYDSDRE